MDQKDADRNLPKKEDVFGQATALAMKYQEENEKILQQLEDKKVRSKRLIFGL